MEPNEATMGRSAHTDQLKLPPPRSYTCTVLVGSIPKLIILVCCAVTSYINCIKPFVIFSLDINA